MRDKGSYECLNIGLAFANAITVENDQKRNLSRSIDCKGPNSVFSALSLSIPSITRTGEGNPSKGAISDIEFCKFLLRSGFKACRHRSRLKGTKNKWTKGVRRWENRRWTDPSNPEELENFQAKLKELTSQNPHLDSISAPKLLSFLSARPEKSNCQSLSGKLGKVPNRPRSELCHSERTVPRVRFITQCRYLYCLVQCLSCACASNTPKFESAVSLPLQNLILRLSPLRQGHNVSATQLLRPQNQAHQPP